MSSEAPGLAGTETTVKTWEPLGRGRPGQAPFKIDVIASWYNDGNAGVWLRCSCGQELGYGDDDAEVSLGELNADAAGHLCSHGQAA